MARIRMWLFAGAALLPVTAYAQVPPPVPVRPFTDTTTVKPPIPAPPPASQDVPRVEVPALPPVSQPAGAEQIRFQLRSIQVEGAVAIDAATIQSTYAGLIGKEVSVADLYAAAGAITGLYRERGYVLSRAIVPAQTIESGDVRIVVVEGYVSEVRIEGEDGPVRARLEGYLKKLEGMRPVRVADLERYLLLANDLPGMRVKGVLRPQPGQPGAAALVVETSHAPFAGFATINNRGSRELGPWSIAAQAGIQSLTAAGEELHVLGYNSLFDFKEQRYFELGGSRALGNEGTRIAATASIGPGNPGGSVLRSLDAESESRGLGFELTHPFIRTRALSVWGMGGYDWTRSETRLAGVVATRERVAELYVGARAEMTDSWDGFTRGEIRLRRGIKGLGGGVDVVALAGNGDPDFTAINAEITRRQPFGRLFEVQAKVAGQYSPDPLLSPARVKFGGLNYLRGYTAGELSGDSGVAYSLEARISDRPDWADLYFVQGYAFFEQGFTWGDAVNGRANLASAGVGVRVLPTEWLILELELAQGLKDGLTGEDRGEKPTKLYLTSTVRF